MSRVTRVLAPIAVVGLAIGVAVILVKTASRPQRASKPPKPALVEVVEARIGDERAAVVAMGTIVASRSVTLRPEVTGRVVEQSASLVPGGRVKKGETLLRIDARHYQLAAQQAESNVQRSQFEMKVEEGRKQIAAREWKLVGDAAKTTDAGKALALREPHMESVEAALASSKSALERAKLDVSRTVLRAPFNAMITDEAVDVGQLVGPTNNLATLVGTDTFWVQVSVPMTTLPWIDVPGVSAEEGSSARIVQDIGATPIEREGRVVRLLGDLDPKGRMARLLVEIDDPLGLERERDGGLPLLLGAYVRVDIEGKTLENVVVVPRRAVREDGTVWIATKENQLLMQPVHVAWRGRDDVYVDRGLSPGDRVIVSRLVTPVPGMKIRTAGDAEERTPRTAEGPKPKSDEAIR